MVELFWVNQGSRQEPPHHDASAQVGTTAAAVIEKLASHYSWAMVNIKCLIKHSTAAVRHIGDYTASGLYNIALANLTGKN